MDWKILGTTFAAVFIAELGDKTQLATLSFATSGAGRLPVFLGSALALVCTSAIAVFGGEALARLVPPRVLQRGAGVLFLLIGAWVLWSTFRSEPAGN
jgi:putative Ca2+/H+ antiporter (TMEM165/GDT1 family)